MFPRGNPMDMMTNRSSPSMMKTQEQVHRQTIRSAHEEIRVRRRSRCGDEGLVHTNLSRCDFGPQGVFACLAHIFFMKKGRHKMTAFLDENGVSSKGGPVLIHALRNRFRIQKLGIETRVEARARERIVEDRG